MPEATWKRSLTGFFADRAATVGMKPELEDLCFVSGRDPRLWRDSSLYDEMIADIVRYCAVGVNHSVVEVGCAAGFLARGVVAHVGQYLGVDLAEPALRVASRLRLANAEFRRADGTRLSLRDNSFDAAFCYDVFTNFPTFSDGANIIREMIRVVRPGGRVLVGSVPDAVFRSSLESKAAEVARCLDERYGVLPARPVPQRDWVKRLRSLWSDRREEFAPSIVCYYFDKAHFENLGKELRAETTITDIHARNPYRGFRFNVIYTKTQQ